MMLPVCTKNATIRSMLPLLQAMLVATQSLYRQAGLGNFEEHLQEHQETRHAACSTEPTLIILDKGREEHAMISQRSWSLAFRNNYCNDSRSVFDRRASRMVCKARLELLRVGHLLIFNKTSCKSIPAAFPEFLF